MTQQPPPLRRRRTRRSCPPEIARHARKCTICRHPQRDEIEMAFLNRELITSTLSPLAIKQSLLCISTRDTRRVETRVSHRKQTVATHSTRHTFRHNFAWVSRRILPQLVARPVCARFAFPSRSGATLGRNSQSTLPRRNSLKIKPHENQRAERPGASSYSEFSATPSAGARADWLLEAAQSRVLASRFSALLLWQIWAQGHRGARPGGSAVMHTAAQRSECHAGFFPREMPIWAVVCADFARGRAKRGTARGGSPRGDLGISTR